MTLQAPLRLYGDYCSPYTRKMLSLLRYRRISYQLLQGGPGGMLANAWALAGGDQKVHTTVDGKTWQQPAFPYQRRCLQWIREQYLALTDSDRQWVDTLLSGTGCEALLQD